MTRVMLSCEAQIGESVNGVYVYKKSMAFGTGNREMYSSSVRADCKCLADQCMMWRNVLNDKDDGHCGLAGFAAHGG